MAVGEKIVSAFSGPADPHAFELEYPVPKEKTHKIIHSSRAIKLHELYENVANIREGKPAGFTLEQVWQSLLSDYQEEWLLPLEILEIAISDPKAGLLRGIVDQYLSDFAMHGPVTGRLIENGKLVLEKKGQEAL
jgi:phenylalanine-4-hydroxylase